MKHTGSALHFIEIKEVKVQSEQNLKILLELEKKHL